MRAAISFVGTDMALATWNPGLNAGLCYAQTRVISIAGQTIPVNTGIGSDRDLRRSSTYQHQPGIAGQVQ